MFIYHNGSVPHSGAGALPSPAHDVHRKNNKSMTVTCGLYLTPVWSPLNRQSYDISIVAQVDQTGSKSSNLLDLKNPFFRWDDGPTPGCGWRHMMVEMSAGGAAWLGDVECACVYIFRYTGSTPNPPPGSHYTSPSENMWNTGSGYGMSQGMAVSGEHACWWREHEFERASHWWGVE